MTKTSSKISTIISSHQITSLNLLMVPAIGVFLSGKGTQKSTLLISNEKCALSLLRTRYMFRHFPGTFSLLQSQLRKELQYFFQKIQGNFIERTVQIVWVFTRRGKLYYLNNVKHSTKELRKSLKQWHETLGHCNIQDILKLEWKVEVMFITKKMINSNVMCAFKQKWRTLEAEFRMIVLVDLLNLCTLTYLDLLTLKVLMVTDRYALVCVDSFSNLTCV